jgi:hypothetical protein
VPSFGVTWRRLVLLLFALVTLGASAVAVAVVPSDARLSARGVSVAVLTVGPTPVGGPIPLGFVGLSMEYPTLAMYAGRNPGAVDPVLEQLIRNLAPQRPVLRIGGSTTDWTWWPIAGTPRPPWVRYVLTKRWVAVTRALAAAVGARLILSINLEANSPQIAGTEARALLGGIGRKWVTALELGNEPELYGQVGWYRTRGGQTVRGRPRGYDFAEFTDDYSRLAASLPPIRLAGLSTSAAPAWSRPLGRFLDAEPRVGIVTVHRYGLDRCDKPAPILTTNELLSVRGQERVAQSTTASVKTAHAHGVPLRIEELNAVACGGQPGVSDTFGSALWALDVMFETARVGVDGVNIHTRAAGLNSLFTVQDIQGRWAAHVRPEYYGLMMFAQAAPSGARLLPVSGAGGTLHAWATHSADGRVRVVLINDDPTRSRTVTVNIPSGSAPATLERLDAPSIASTDDVTLGGQSFGPQTSTGVLAGQPQIVSIPPVGGGYPIEVPAASAAMLTS